jgi:hypothetical protein
MKKAIIGIVLAFVLVSNSYAAINPFTGYTEGTPWESFTAQQSKAGLLVPIKHKRVSLTAAQINGMYAAPVLVLAAPGSGKSIAIVKAIFRITRTATAFANGGAVIIQYDSTVNGGGTQACDSTLASTVITGAAGTSFSIRNGAIISDSTATIVNKGIYLSNATGAFDTGTGTGFLDVYYTEVP